MLQAFRAVSKSRLKDHKDYVVALSFNDLMPWFTPQEIRLRDDTSGKIDVIAVAENSELAASLRKYHSIYSTPSFDKFSNLVYNQVCTAKVIGTRTVELPAPHAPTDKPSREGTACIFQPQ